MGESAAQDMSAMEIETPADMANTTLGKRGGREDSVCEESANKCEKTHVDTNAITRAGVTEDFDSLLRFYYGKAYPFPKMWKWLSYANTSAPDFGSRREFSFTLDGDIYIRYLSFLDAKAWQAECMKKLPHKMDMGAVYTAPPKDHNSIKASEFRPVERELVFDIDLTDYDDVRTSGSGASITRRCWLYMVAAIKVMDVALREDFGFEHLLWVYSGRRGVHCWVADPRARRLDNAARCAIGSYFDVINGKEGANGEASRKVELKTPVHPSLRRALGILRPLFMEMMQAEQQGWLESSPNPNELTKSMEQFLVYFPEESSREKLRRQWSNSKTPEDRWRQFENEVKKVNNQKGKLSKPITEELILSHLYPRLDVHVTQAQNHLLKSPWVIHPKTGRVCVPFDPHRCEDFNPETVPTVQDLFTEYNNASSKMESNEFMKQSCVAPYLQVFDDFMAGLETTFQAERVARAREVRGQESMEF